MREGTQDIPRVSTSLRHRTFANSTPHWHRFFITQSLQRTKNRRRIGEISVFPRNESEIVTPASVRPVPQPRPALSVLQAEVRGAARRAGRRAGHGGRVGRARWGAGSSTELAIRPDRRTAARSCPSIFAVVRE